MNTNNAIAGRLDKIQSRCIVCDVELSRKYLAKGKIRCYDCNSALGRVWPLDEKTFMEFFKGQE